MTDSNKLLVASLPFNEAKYAVKKVGVLAMHVQDAIAAGVIGSDMVVPTLEGSVTAKSNSMILKGAAGEIWPVSPETLIDRYVPDGCDVIAGPAYWTSYVPNGKNHVLALKVDDRDEFVVELSSGNLTGKRGDYVLMDGKNPDSIWIVNSDLFDKTYQIKDAEELKASNS